MSLLQAKVTTKGQVTLPKAVRQSLSIQSGDRIAFSMDESNSVVVRKMQTAGSSVGCGKKYIKEGQVIPTKLEVKAAVGEALRRKFAK